MNPTSENSASGRGNPSDEPLSARPLDPLSIPRDIMDGDSERVFSWVYNLTTDELQQYGLVGLRGEDPRLDVPDDYRDRDNVIDKMLRISLWTAGIRAAGDQTEWLRSVVDRETGMLTFPRRNGEGPDWGWGLSTENGLDDPCGTGYIYYVQNYFLWRAGGKSDSTIFDWEATTNFADIRAKDSVQTFFATPIVDCNGQTQNWNLCQLEMRYFSKPQTFNIINKMED